MPRRVMRARNKMRRAKINSALAFVEGDSARALDDNWILFAEKFSFWFLQRCLSGALYNLAGWLAELVRSHNDV
jgi:hypothetical protein